MVNRLVGKNIAVRVCGVRFLAFFLKSGFVDEASFTDSVGSVHHSSGGGEPVGRHTVMPVAVKGRTEIAWDLECQMTPETNWF
jgi:hypothetical protein